MIGGPTPPWNELWNLWYIFKKIWYIRSLGYRDPYIPSYGPFDPLRTLGKWLQSVPHLKMDFATLGTSLRKFGTSLWNQGLVNLGIDDNKTRFWTNDYISSVFRQDDFQSGNHKNKSSLREIMKKKTTSKRSFFQDPSFIRSLCKVVGALRFWCIKLFTYAPKSFKSYFVLNIFKIGWFHVFN